MENIYWISFSGKGCFLGVVLVEATSKEGALEKAKDLDLWSKNTIDIEIFLMESEEAIEEAKSFEFNRLITEEELLSKKYQKAKYRKIANAK